MRPQKTLELTEFEQQLESLNPIESSSNYYSKGMEILSNRTTRSFFQWRTLVTGVLAMTLVASLCLNFIQFKNASATDSDNGFATTDPQAPKNPALMANQFSGEKQVVLSPPTNNEAEERYVLGEDFNLIDASMLGEGNGRLQVSNFFWYGCNYCFDFDQLINPWRNQHEAEFDLNYQRIPAVWSDLMLIHARAYYAAMEFPNAEAIHQTLFTALHVNKNAYTSEQSIAPLFSEHGIEYDDYAAAFNAPRTILLADEAQALTKEMRSLGLNGVPGLIVNRRYLVKNTNFNRMLNVADYLIHFEQERYSEGTDGAVVIEFDVDADGSVSSVEVGRVTKLRLNIDKALKERKQQTDRPAEVF